MATPALKETPRQYAARLAFTVPLTAWPVLIYFRNLEDQRWGRHSASATAIVAPTLGGIVVATSFLAILLAIFGKSSFGTKVFSILFILLNFWLLIEFCMAGTSYYV